MGLREKFTENAEQFDALMVEMLAENDRLKQALSLMVDINTENKKLKQAIIELMPVLHDWDPDHSKPEERNIIRKAQQLVTLKQHQVNNELPREGQNQQTPG